ncbi:MAG: DUF1993 domain-containing protein [Bacteriovoracaceae bacterium]|nr:DUF1993 domain-containing protein [Bacteriovoracaceae bacterium]
MNITVNEIISEQFTMNLLALKNIMEKAKAHATERKFNPDLFLDMKLAPDMFTFARQVQIATDNAKGAAARLSGKTAPVFEDKEKTMDELIERVGKTLNFLEGFSEKDFADAENKKITFPWYPGKFIGGRDYLISHAIPNVYFHLTTAYALLRMGGVKIGKVDFLGNQNWQQA